MNTSKKRALWPYVVVSVAVIVAFAIVVVLVFPNMITGRTTPKLPVSEYAEGEYTLKSPANKEELLKTLKKHEPKDNYYGQPYVNGGIMLIDEAPAMEEAAAADGVLTAKASDAVSTEHSDTNIRTEGVLEGDNVKVDGHYIFSLCTADGTLTIVDSKDDMKTVYSGKILDDDYSYKELFVHNSKLYVSGYSTSYSYSERSSEGIWLGSTFLLTFDLSDITQPKLIDTYCQSGSYYQSRIVDNTFYLFTEFSCTDLESDNYIPMINGQELACDDIYYGKYFDYAKYNVVSAVDLATPSEAISVKAVLTDWANLYVSDSNIYLLSQRWLNEPDHSWVETDITSLAYANGVINGNAVGSVQGSLNDTFSVDEHNGYLRIVTNVNETFRNSEFFLGHVVGGNDSATYENNQNASLWILDKNLSLVSSLEKIQKNEQVKSARFIGDIVYFVTFRQTDPLFAADLSDPFNPQMLAGIELTGFSSYLHPWSENLLLGIGYEADEYGNISGAKLAMYDISDPKNVKEIERYVINENANVDFLSSDYSYKAVMVQPGKNLIGFAMQTYRYAPDDEFEGTSGKYVVFSYDETEGFKELLTHKLYEDNYYYNYIIEDYVIDEEYTLEDAEDTEKPEEETTSLFEQFAEAQKEEAKQTEISEPWKEAFDKIPESNQYSYTWIGSVRGAYIGNNLYIIHPGVAVYKYDMNDFSLVKTHVIVSDKFSE